MPSARRRLVVSTALALLLLTVLAAAWIRVAPVYNDLAAALANTLSPAAVKVSGEGTRLVQTYKSPLRSREYHAEIDGLALHGGLLLVIAIVLATPGMALLKRGAWAGTTFGGFLLVHAVTLAFLSWAYMWANG